MVLNASYIHTLHSTTRRELGLDYRQLHPWVSGRQNHPVHSKQIKKIHSKYQKLISECIFS